MTALCFVPLGPDLVGAYTVDGDRAGYIFREPSLVGWCVSLYDAKGIAWWKATGRTVNDAMHACVAAYAEQWATEK